MEAYRSYSESRTPYADPVPPEYEYSEGTNWYGERFREPERPDDRYLHQERYDERARRDYERYDEPRREYPHPRTDEPHRSPVSGSRSAPPAEEPPPARRSSAASAPPAASPAAPTASGPPSAPSATVTSGPGSEGLYRGKRPGTAVLLGAPAAVLEIPALLLLVDAVTGDPMSPGGVVAGSCLALALPLLAFGLYGVATGAVRAAGPNSVQAWLRPPVAYVTVGLALFLAAGLAG